MGAQPGELEASSSGSLQERQEQPPAPASPDRAAERRALRAAAAVDAEAAPAKLGWAADFHENMELTRCAAQPRQ